MVRKQDVVYRCNKPKPTWRTNGLSFLGKYQKLSIKEIQKTCDNGTTLENAAKTDSVYLFLTRKVVS